MKESPVRIVKHFCEQFFDELQPDQFSLLEQYFKAGGSVCALARKGADGLVSEYGLKVDNAQAIALRLNGLATWVLRRFIEEQLIGSESLPTHMRHGLLALVEGPTYDGLFKPNFANKCPSDAIEAIHSPVAYAVTLKHWSENRLIPSEQAKAYPLNTRRKDLNELSINPATAYGVVSSVEVVSAVLEKSIEASIGQVDDLDQVLSDRRYPNGLPYHHPWVTMDELARDLGMSVGTVVGLCDPQSPYFLRALPWGETSNHALIQSTRFSPSQREIFTEARHFPDGDRDKYFERNYGLLNVEAGNLPQAPYFNQKSNLTQPGLEALLSVELFATTVSEYAPVFADVPVTPGHAFSVFINDGLAAKSMEIRYGGTAMFNKIYETTDDRFDRLNRKIRLDNSLNLPSHETDALLSAIIGAESKSPPAEADSEARAVSYWMTDNTLRALGLFQMAREYYQCSAEDFAVFVGNISIFGRGSERSQFDRVFNKDTLSMPPLLVDDKPFALMPLTDADALTVVQICSSLNIDLATYFKLAPLIAESHALTGLKRSVAVLSSFYRMARLPQMLGIAPGLAVDLLMLLSSGSWNAALAGEPFISADAMAKTPDVLTVMQRLVGWVRWSFESDLDVAWAIEHVIPVAAPPQATEAQIQLFTQLRTHLTPALFTETALQMAGVPELSNGRHWTNQLLELADQDGLVIHRSESAAQPYTHYAREVVKRVVREVIGHDDEQTVERMVGVVLSSRSGQHSVVQESLAVYGELASPMALPVLSWSGGTVYDVLSYISSHTAADNTSTSSRREEEPGDPFLGMLCDFARRAEVVKELKLSAEFLTLYLIIEEVERKRSLAPEPFTPTALYYLTVYNRAVKLSNKPESQLLSYLRRINALPNNLSGDGLILVKEQAAKLLAELFDWSAEEVRLCADHVNAGRGYIRSLVHLDLLIRVRAFTLQSKLDAPTVLKMGKLKPESLFNDYKTLADQVAARLAEQGRTLPLAGITAVADQVVFDCTVDSTELIANSKGSAQLTLKITRAQLPLKNVNIYWASKLCSIDPPVSTTNAEGTATVTVHAGTTMGRDVISYRLDAREPQPGVVITLRNDPTSFAFFRLDNEIYTTSEKVGTDVTLRMHLLDKHGNPAGHTEVNWLLEPLFALPVTIPTNADGITEITFTSPEPLTINAPRVLGNDVSFTLRPITFTL